MIGQSIEHSMQEAHRGVRERLGMPVTTRPVRVVVKREPPALPPPTEPEDIQTYWSVPTFSVAICQIGIADDAVIKEGRFSIDAKWPEIVRQVCEKHRVSPLEIKSRYRDPRIVKARHEAFYRLRTETTMSFPQIGTKMGGFDHSTAISGYKSHLKRIENGDEK